MLSKFLPKEGLYKALKGIIRGLKCLIRLSAQHAGRLHAKMAERQSTGGADPATRDKFGMQCTPPPRRPGLVLQAPRRSAMPSGQGLIPVRLFRALKGP